VSIDQQFKTQDLSLAAYLLFDTFHLNRVECLARGKGQKATYVFDVASEDLQAAIDDYEADRGVMGIKTLARCVRYLWSCEGEALRSLGEYRPRSQLDLTAAS
jgi:Domain of unknown function (DUF5659)